jgi:hypothetical protein
MGVPQNYYEQVRWLPVKNTSGETAPPFAVLLVTGFEASSGAWLVAKPNADDTDPIMLLINNHVGIPAGGYGSASLADPVEAKITGNPSAGDQIGTAANQWHLAGGKKGFRAWSGDLGSGTAMVRWGYKALVGVSFNPETCDINGTQLSG